MKDFFTVIVEISQIFFKGFYIILLFLLFVVNFFLLIVFLFFERSKRSSYLFKINLMKKKKNSFIKEKGNKILKIFFKKVKSIRQQTTEIIN